MLRVQFAADGAILLKGYTNASQIDLTQDVVFV